VPGLKLGLEGGEVERRLCSSCGLVFVVSICRLGRRKEQRLEGSSLYETGSGVGLDLGASHPGTLPIWVRKR
jgi:hypothetical protein